jgi:hypothetical protein
MKTWLIFNSETGEVIKKKTSPETSKLNLVLAPGEDAIEADLSGVYVDITTVRPVPFPAKPSPHHDWDWATKSWLPNLDVAREAQRQAWNAWRDRELVAGFSHNGHVFHSDDTFIGELQLLLKGYEREYITSTSAIRTRGNAVLQMTNAEIETLLLLIGLHRQVIYAQSWAGKDALADLTTLEDIMAGGPPS